jgi:hypothetical protein
LSSDDVRTRAVTKRLKFQRQGGKTGGVIDPLGGINSL